MDALAPGASIVITKDGQPHARLEKAHESIFGSLAKFVVPGADLSLEALKVMDPEIEAMFEGRELTLLEDRSKA